MRLHGLVEENMQLIILQTQALETQVSNVQCQSWMKQCNAYYYLTDNHVFKHHKYTKRAFVPRSFNFQHIAPHSSPPIHHTLPHAFGFDMSHPTKF